MIVKKTLVSMLASLALTTTAMAAAPATDLNAGQIQLGYSYENLQTQLNGIGDLGTYHGSDITAAYGLSDNLAVTADFLNSEPRSFNVNIPGSYTGTLSDVKYGATELGLQYKLTDNLSLLAGSLKSNLSANGSTNSVTETYGGVAYHQSISPNTTVYASYLKSSGTSDLKTGLTYQLSRDTALDVGYHDYQNNGTGSISAKGMSLGLNHKF